MIHSTAVVAGDADLGAGSVIGPWSVVGIDGEGGPVRLRGVIRSHCVVYRGVRSGEGLHLGHGVLVREETTMGDSVSVGSHSVVEHHVVMGHRVRLHTGCFVPELSILEDDAWLGPHVVLTNARYPNEPDTKERLEGVRIGRGARVGAGVVVLPGVTIGAGALVGAGAVVTDDVAPGVVVAGNPARSLR